MKTCWFLGVFCLCLALCAGAVDSVEPSSTGGPITRVPYDWTSDASGDATGRASSVTPGIIFGVVTTPDGTHFPSDNYDIEIVQCFDNVDGTSVNVMTTDLFSGALANRDNGTVEHVTLWPSTVQTILGYPQIEISNAGSNKRGRVELLVYRTLAIANEGGDLPISGTTANMLQWESAGKAKWIEMSGDVEISDGGVTTIQEDAVGYQDISDTSVRTNHILDGTVASEDLATWTPALSAEGLIGYWLMDEGGVVDYSGDGSDGTSGGGGFTLVTGRWGQAASFAGDGYIDCGSVIGPSYGNEDLTYSCWFKTDGNGTLMGFKRAAGGAGIILDVSANVLRMWIYESSHYFLSGTTSVTDDEWHHAAMVRNFGGTNYLYLDGELENSAADDSDDASGAYEFGFGAIKVGGTPDAFLTGEIDDSMVFERALSAAEVRALYLSRNQVVDITGDRVVEGDLSVYGGDLVAGYSGTTRGTVVAREGAGPNAPGTLALCDKNGEDWYTFTDTSGNLHTGSASSPSPTSGNKVVDEGNVGSIGFTGPSPDGSNTDNVVRVQLNPNSYPWDLTDVFGVVWLSDVDKGAVTTNAPDTSTSWGTGLIREVETDIMWEVNLGGGHTLTITDTGDQAYYLNAAHPFTGKIHSVQIEAADYGDGT